LGGEFTSAISTARPGDAAVSEHEEPTKIQLGSLPGPQSFNQERHLDSRDVIPSPLIAPLGLVSVVLGQQAIDKVKHYVPPAP